MRRTQSNYQIKVYSQIQSQQINKITSTHDENKQNEDRIQSARPIQFNNKNKYIDAEKGRLEIKNKNFLSLNMSRGTKLNEMKKCKLKIVRKNQLLTQFDETYQRKQEKCQKFNPEVSEQQYDSSLESYDCQNTRSNTKFQNDETQWSQVFQIEISLGKIYYKYSKSNPGQFELILAYGKLKHLINYVQMTEGYLKIGDIKQDLLKNDYNMLKLRASSMKIYHKIPFRQFTYEHSKSDLKQYKFDGDIPQSIAKLVQYSEWIKFKIEGYINSNAQKPERDAFDFQSSSPIQNLERIESTFRHQYNYCHGNHTIIFTIKNSGEAEIQIHEWNKGLSAFSEILKFEKFQKFISKEYQSYLVKILGSKNYETILKTYAKYWFQNVADF